MNQQQTWEGQIFTSVPKVHVVERNLFLGVFTMQTPHNLLGDGKKFTKFKLRMEGEIERFPIGIIMSLLQHKMVALLYMICKGLSVITSCKSSCFDILVGVHKF